LRESRVPSNVSRRASSIRKFLLKTEKMVELSLTALGPLADWISRKSYAQATAMLRIWNLPTLVQGVTYGRVGSLSGLQGAH
jgi:hypothetical protein